MEADNFKIQYLLVQAKDGRDKSLCLREAIQISMRENIEVLLYFNKKGMGEGYSIRPPDILQHVETQNQSIDYLFRKKPKDEKEAKGSLGNPPY